MLKDQLIAFALLIPFLFGGAAGPKAGTTAVAMDPPIASKADDKKPPVTPVEKALKTPVEIKVPDKTSAGTVPKKEDVKKPENPVTPPVASTGPQKETKPAVDPKLPPAQVPPVITEVSAGTGAKVNAGERAVFHFAVADALGKEFVNSKKRGLPFAVEAGSDLLWDGMLKDMKVGGVRRIALMPDQVNAGKGLPPYIPAGVPVTVTVWLLKAEK